MFLGNCSDEILDILSAYHLVQRPLFGLYVDDRESKLVFHDDTIDYFITRGDRCMATISHCSVTHPGQKINNKLLKGIWCYLQHLAKQIRSQAVIYLLVCILKLAIRREV